MTTNRLLNKYVILVSVVVIGCISFSGGSSGPGFLYDGRYYYNTRVKGLCSYSSQDGFNREYKGASGSVLLGAYGDEAILFSEIGGIAEIYAYHLEERTKRSVLRIEDIKRLLLPDAVSFEPTDPVVNDGKINIIVREKHPDSTHLILRYYSYDIGTSEYVEFEERPQSEIETLPYDQDLMQIAAQDTAVSGYKYDGRYLHGWSWEYNHVSNVYEISYIDGRPVGKFIHHIPYTCLGFDLPL